MTNLNVNMTARAPVSSVMTARAPGSALVPVSSAVPLPSSKDVAVVAPKEVPDIIVDPNTKVRYERGKFLGKGGFAKCYELKNMSTGELLAGKIVPKSMLTKTHQKEKMSQVSERKLLSGRNFFVLLFVTYFVDLVSLSGNSAAQVGLPSLHCQAVLLLRGQQLCVSIHNLCLIVASVMFVSLLLGM